MSFLTSIIEQSLKQANERVASRRAELEAKPAKVLRTTTRTFLHCPECEKETNLDAENYTSVSVELHASYCPHCGAGFFVKHLGGGQYEAILWHERREPRLELLVLPENLPHPVYLLMNGDRYTVNRRLAGDEDAAAYFYNSGSCPENWLGNVEKIVYAGDTDPHGLIRYVRGASVASMLKEGQTEEEFVASLDDDAVLATCFPEMFGPQVFSEIIRTKEYEELQGIEIWLQRQAPEVFQQRYKDWMLKLMETMVDEGKLGDRWASMYFLSQTLHGARELNAILYPKKRELRKTKDGKDVYVLAKAAFVVDADDRVLEFIEHPGYVRGAELEG